MLKQILHSWNDEDVCRLPSVAHLLDLVSLLVGGRERTREQCTSLLGSAGYRFVSDTPVTDVLPWHVLEFRRM